MAAAGDEPAEAKRARAATTGRLRCWSSAFPDDILAVVYGMVASARGRVRFAAVCRSWRAVARAEVPPPALPWLLLESSDCSDTKYLHCPEDGADAIVWIQLPSCERLVGCHDGGWVVSSPPLRITNLFSGAEVALPENQRGIFCYDKLVFSKPPTSDGCTLATITEYRGIALCRVGYPDSVWTRQKHRHSRRLEDITFCNGELYGLTKFQGDVYKFEIGVNEDGEPVVTAANLLNCPLWEEYVSESEKSYIFDLHGKIAVAISARCSRNPEGFFKVFELVDIHGDGPATSCKHKWVEVTSLDDHALFLGRTFSKAVRVPDGKVGHLERNHIYYSRCLSKNDVVPHGAILFFTLPTDFGDRKYYRVEDWKNKDTSDDVKRIKSTGYFVDSNHYDSMWILPPDM
ncbi:hypothetical protein VPH35_094070 [Triticum aestivum]